MRNGECAYTPHPVRKLARARERCAKGVRRPRAVRKRAWRFGGADDAVRAGEMSLDGARSAGCARVCGVVRRKDPNRLRRLVSRARAGVLRVVESAVRGMAAER